MLKLCVISTVFIKVQMRTPIVRNTLTVILVMTQSVTSATKVHQGKKALLERVRTAAKA